MTISAKDVDDAVAQIDASEFHTIADAFRNKAASKELSDPWRLLAEVFDMHFRPGNATEPFGPMWVMNGKRSMIPTDLLDEHRNTLREIMRDSSNTEVRARIGDILWVTDKDATAARIAVEAYLEAGARVEDPEKWTYSMERYERAARLASSLGKNDPLLTKVLDHIEARVKHYAGNDPLYFTLHGLRLLHEFHHGNHAELSVYAITAADEALSASDFHRARNYYEIATELLESAGKKDKAGALRTTLAETYVQEAEQCEQRGDFLLAHHWWEDAIQAYRLAPGGKEKVAELHKRLNESGEKSHSSMKAIGVNIDISKEVKDAQGRVAGLPLADAICTLASFLMPLDPKTLREEALEAAKAAPLSAMMPVRILDERGRTVAKSAGMHPTNDEKQENNAIERLMLQHANMERGLRVQGYIWPALCKLLEEHQIDTPKIEALLRGSKFIPDNRMSLFVRGITAGFQKDFVLALHLLIPQLEYALRQHLHNNGVIPERIDAEGIQEDWTLRRVLAQEKLQQILSPGLVYELKTILNDKRGANLRNLSAHGLLNEEAFNSPISVYCWWIILRLCLIQTPIFADFIARHKKNKDAADGLAHE